MYRGLFQLDYVVLWLKAKSTDLFPLWDCDDLRLQQLFDMHVSLDNSDEGLDISFFLEEQPWPDTDCPFFVLWEQQW